MAYCTQEDLELGLSIEAVAQLSNDVDPTTVNAAAINRAIADADSAIDSFCRGKAEVPFDPVPDSVRRWSVSLSIVNLYARRTDLLLPPATKEKHDLVMTELRAVRDNKILINTPDEPSNTASYYKVKKGFSQPIFKTTDEKTGRLDRFYGPRDGMDVS